MYSIFSGQKKQPLGSSSPLRKKKEWHLNLRVVNYFLLALVVTGGVYYFVGMNDLIVKGFVLQSLKSQANMLADEKKDAETKIMALQSYGNLSNRIKGLNMVATGEVDYLSISNSLMARK